MTSSTHTSPTYTSPTYTGSTYGEDRGAERPQRHQDDAAFDTRTLPRVEDRQTSAPAARRDGIDQGRYWTGAALGAAIAALAAVTMLILLQILPIAIFGHDAHRVSAGLAGYGLGAAAVALAAAAIYNVMLRIAPRPSLYYCWLAVLGTALATLMPFTSGAPLATEISFASINFVVGLILSFLVPMAAVKAKR